MLPKNRLSLFAYVILSMSICSSVLASDDKLAYEEFHLSGNEVGNGGDVVVCLVTKAPRTYGYEVLDAFEAREIRGIDVDIYDVDGDAFEKAKAAILRLQTLDPYRTQLFLRMLEEFPHEMRLLSGRDFPDITDTNHFPLPKDCVLEQAVVQQQKIFPHDKRYLIHEETWNTLDESQKAIMIVHEIVYGEGIRHGHTTSEYTRYLTSLLISKEIQKMSLSTYEGILRTMRLDRIRFRDVEAKIDWELSEEKLTYQQAIEFCFSRGLSVFDKERIFIKALTSLRGSFIGKYYIETPDGLETWAWHEAESPSSVVKLSQDYEEEYKPTESVYRVLCFKPN